MITIIVLWILLGIIAVIVILLHFSITAQIDLNKKGFDLKVRYMFFDIYPRKPKKKKQIVEAKPEKIEKNEADENVSVAEVEDKQEDISDIDTDTNVEAGAEDKPEKITVKQEKKGFVGKLFHKKDKGEKKPVSKSKEKKKSKFYKLKAQYKKVKPYIPMGWKYFKKLLKAIRFTDTRIVLDVGKEDAYEAAMLYGKVQAGLFNTIAILAGVFTVKLKKADVNCIFDEKKFGYDVHTLVRVRPSTLIAIGFCTGVNFLKIYLSGRRKKKRAAKRRSKELAAKKNEVKATN